MPKQPGSNQRWGNYPIQQETEIEADAEVKHFELPPRLPGEQWYQYAVRVRRQQLSNEQESVINTGEGQNGTE